MLADPGEDQIPPFGQTEIGDDIDDMPIVRRFVAAGTTAAPVTSAARSVFDLAEVVAAAAHMLQKNGRFGDAAGFEVHHPQPVKAKIDRTDGVTRCTGAAYPSRWTEEDEERERQRRARQTPPKPTKKVRTKSRKLIEMAGEF